MVLLRKLIVDKQNMQRPLNFSCFSERAVPLRAADVLGKTRHAVSKWAVAISFHGSLRTYGPVDATSRRNTMMCGLVVSVSSRTCSSFSQLTQYLLPQGSWRTRPFPFDPCSSRLLAVLSPKDPSESSSARRIAKDEAFESCRKEVDPGNYKPCGNGISPHAARRPPHG